MITLSTPAGRAPLSVLPFGPHQGQQPGGWKLERHHQESQKLQERGCAAWQGAASLCRPSPPQHSLEAREGLETGLGDGTAAAAEAGMGVQGVMGSQELLWAEGGPRRVTPRALAEATNGSFLGAF